MQKIISPKFIITIIVVAAFMLIIKSCKKTDSNEANNKDNEASRAAIIKAIQKRYGNLAGGVVFNVNKNAEELFYKNTLGEMVSLSNSNATNSHTGINRPAPCLANCNSTSNPADLRIIYTLDYVQRLYNGCENSNTATPPTKSTVSVKWTVSVPFNLGYTIGFPPLTYGTVKFTPSGGGTPIILTAVNSEVTETQIGPDPSCPTWNNLWEITYTFTEVPNSYFAIGTQLDAALSLENDCALTGSVIASGYVNGPVFSQNAYLPCNRVDRVGIAPGGPGISTPPYTSVSGNHAGPCSYPNPWISIAEQQLEYRKVNAVSGSTLWTNQTSPVYWGIPAFTSSTYPTVQIAGISYLINMAYLGDGTKWLVRYRNVSSNCGIIFNTSGSNNTSTDPQAGADWGNPALWVTEKFVF